jgi:hypothetical protein
MNSGRSAVGLAIASWKATVSGLMSTGISPRQSRGLEPERCGAHDSPLEGGGFELSVLVETSRQIAPWPFVVLSVDNFGSRSLYPPPLATLVACRWRHEAADLAPKPNFVSPTRVSGLQPD